MTEELISGQLPGPEQTANDEPVGPGEKVKKPRGKAAVKIKLENLEKDLGDRIREYVAVPIGMVSPLGCAVLDERADRTAKALCNIAANSPRMRKALERFVTGSSLVDVGGTMVAVFIAVSVDLHKIEPMSVPARFANVPELWPVVYPNEDIWQFSQNGHSDVHKRGFAFEEPEAGN